MKVRRAALSVLLLAFPVALLSALPAGATAAPTPIVNPVRPLVIVLDTSGSMSEDDGTGTIKLAGAQAALSRAIRKQRPGSQMGLWTYPGGGSCAPGSWTSKIGQDDPRALIRKLRALEADGDTPTSEALRAVADALSSTYDGATILLISDGLSTCEDPCETARQIRSEGFDLTVQAAGFQISEDGLSELQCIADATGGQVYEATDSRQLDEVVTEFAGAQLSLDVDGIPARAPAGSASRVTVTVTNESAIDIEDARVSFDFSGGGSGSDVVPAVLPPLLRIGNVPAGQSKDYTWVVGYGSRGKTGTAGYRISAWGTNAQPVTQRGSVEVVDLIQGLADGGGEIAELDGKRIAILGDSYSAGEGAGSYLEGTDENKWAPGPANQCHQSADTYMYSLFAEDEVDLLACSGATSHYIGGKKNGVREDQVPVLDDVQNENGAVSAAFLTIGGNDIGFSSIVKQCLFLHPSASLTWLGPQVTLSTRCSDDEGWKDEIYARIDQLGGELATTYREISDQLNRADFVDERDGEIAPLYVLAYPQPFPERQWASWCRGFDNHEIEFANDLLDRLDERIERTVAKVRKEGYRVEMVATTQETFLPDNSACPRPGADEFMNSVFSLEALDVGLASAVLGSAVANQFMHPNAQGYQAETNTILQWSVTDAPATDDDGDWNTSSAPVILPDWLNPTVIAGVLVPPQTTAGPAIFDASRDQWLSDPLDARGRQSVEVQVRNAAPGSEVSVSMASRVRTIGTIQVGEDGSGSGRVVIPAGAQPGTHRLTALGFDEDGNPALAAQTIDVAGAYPLWLTPLSATTVLLLALAWWFRRVDRRQRRRADAQQAGQKLTAAGRPAPH